MYFQFYSDKLANTHTLSVDGIAPLGTNLSHWPNNRTKNIFKADTSTEICLNFIKYTKINNIKPKEKILTINHYDTDGFLSLSTILYPKLSLENENLIINSAITGDFRRFTNKHALKIDLTVAALSNNTNSPVYNQIKSLDEIPKRQLLYETLFKLYPIMLSKKIDSFSYLWQNEFNSIIEELKQKNKIKCIYHKNIDLAIINTPLALHDITISTISYPASRILTVINNNNKPIYNFKYTVDSWFSIISRKVKKRIDLSKLTRSLNKIENNGIWENNPLNYPVCQLYNNSPSSIPYKTIKEKFSNFFNENTL